MLNSHHVRGQRLLMRCSFMSMVNEPWCEVLHFLSNFQIFQPRATVLHAAVLHSIFFQVFFVSIFRFSAVHISSSSLSVWISVFVSISSFFNFPGSSTLIGVFFQVFFFSSFFDSIFRRSPGAVWGHTLDPRAAHFFLVCTSNLCA